MNYRYLHGPICIKLTFQALELNGRGLLEFVAISYRLGLIQSETPKPSLNTTKFLIVADPSGNLPEARAEAMNSISSYVLRRVQSPSPHRL